MEMLNPLQMKWYICKMKKKKNCEGLKERNTSTCVLCVLDTSTMWHLSRLVFMRWAAKCGKKQPFRPWIEICIFIFIYFFTLFFFYHKMNNSGRDTTMACSANIKMLSAKFSTNVFNSRNWHWQNRQYSKSFHLLHLFTIFIPVIFCFCYCFTFLNGFVVCCCCSIKV